MIPNKQAGFQPNRSYCDQVLALTSFIPKRTQNRCRVSGFIGGIRHSMEDRSNEIKPDNQAYEGKQRTC